MAIKIPTKLFSVLNTEETDQILEVKNGIVVFCPSCLTREQRDSMRSKILQQGFHYSEKHCKECRPDTSKEDKSVRSRIGKKQARDLWLEVCK